MSSHHPASPSLHALTLSWQLFENNPDCVKLLSQDGRLLAINPAGRCAIGIDDFAAIEGMPWKSMWPADMHGALDAAIAAASSGGAGHFKGFGPTVQGVPKWWDVTVNPIAGPDGQETRLLAVSRDITAAHQAQLALQVSEARFRSLVTAASAIVWNCPATGGFQSEQPAWTAFTGQTFEEYKYDGWLAAVHPDERAATAAEWEAAHATRSIYRVEHRLRRADGAYRDMSVKAVPIFDAAGAVAEWVGVHTDITERKLAEIRLHASRERFEKIVSQAATGVVEMDTAGRITFVNQKYAEMLGYAPHELIGLTAEDVTAPDSVARTAATLRKLLADGVEAVIDKHYLRKDGSLMPATSSINALRGRNGDILGLVAIVLDTTESERAAQKLRASEERYRTLFESMDQGFCVIEILFDDAQQPVDYRFVEVNAMFEQHSGLMHAAGKTFRELLPGRPCGWIDVYARVALTGQSTRFEEESQTLGRWFDVYATRIGGEHSRRVALLFSDVSARRQAEATLRQLATDLSEANRRKTEFLATLAHELRNPLAPIRSGLSVLRLGGDSKAAVTKVREMMERQVGHMVHLIDDLLDIARISGDKLELKKTRADLNTVLSSAIETSLPMIEAGHHELDVDLPADPLTADVDITRVAQVVANLLNNAAKYTPARGRIGLAMRRENDTAVISVTDTGVGIPADALGSVFEMFSQIGRSLDRAQGGLGIGLSLVRRLVEMHEGSVAATSAGPGCGSTFTVRLPLAPVAVGADAAPAGQGTAAAPATGGARVLVVDDNVDAALTLSMILEMSGHTTRVAHDGIEAIDVLHEFRPQLAFLDIGMPRMNGHDTAKAIRRMPGMEHVTLVALTGWGAEDDRMRSSEAGFDHHLTKPVQLADVERILAGVGQDGGDQ